MDDENNLKSVTPPPGEGTNYYSRIVFIGVGGVLLGASILVFYLAFLLPAFHESYPKLIKIALILAPLTFSMNYFVSIRRSQRMVEWMKKDVRGQPIDEQLWHDARAAALKLPRLSASFSFVLWPTAMLAMSLIMLVLGNFGWYETILSAISGLLVGPLNAMTYFYAIRKVMYQVLKRLGEYPFEPRDIVVPKISLRFKLVFSYICLVISPMLFAVILDRHQGDKFETKKRQAYTENVIAEFERDWVNTRNPDVLKKVLENAATPLVDFFVLDRAGNLILGNPSPAFRQYVFERMPKDKNGMFYLHRFDQYISFASLDGVDAWVLGAFHRVDSSGGFWRRNWLITVLLIFLGGFGVLLAIAASNDTVRSAEEMMKISELVQKGDFTGHGVYLNDDELGLLGEVLNKLVKSMNEQLEISHRMIADIRSAIVRLGKENEEVYKVVSRQRLGVRDQAAGIAGARSVSGQITDAARSIQEKAGSIRDLADSTNMGCANGRTVLEDASDGMKLTGASMDEISRRIYELATHFESIVEVVSMIEEISEHTDLLALNASLEAVGAGEFGRRFAVVAKQVRRLADKTTQSTAKIRSLFQNISESNNACVGTINDGHEKVQYELGIMERLQQSLDEISRHAGTTSEAVAQIHLMTSQQTTACMQMQDTLTDAATAGKVVEEGAGVTEESMRSLKELASGLQRMIEKDAEKKRLNNINDPAL